MNKVLIALVSIVMLAACNNERSAMQDEIVALEKKAVADSSNFTFDAKVQNELGVKLVAYAEKFPEDKQSDEYLFKAASLYIGMGQSQKALETLRKYLKVYPGGKSAPEAVFNIGYVYDTQLHNAVKARESYEAFVSNYPKHPLVKDTQIMIQLLDQHMNDEDLVHGFLAKEKADSIAAAEKNLKAKN